MTIKGGVHAAIAHESAVKHATGEAVYIDDMPRTAETLDAWLVTSPHAHARIKRIDVSRAAARPGVVVATAADIPGANDVGPIFRNEPILARDVVTYVGEPVVAVAAPTLDEAIAAAKLVKVEYARLKPVLSIEDALAKEQYVSPVQLMRRGDAAAAIAAAAHRLEGEVRCGGQDHFYLEGQIALAIPGEDDEMLVHSSTQHPTEVQHSVARVLGIAANAVTVEVRRMGGGFGGKESQASSIAALAALLSVRAQAPVKLRLTRDVDMVVTGKRHDFLIRYTVGVDERGVIQGLDMALAANGGNVADHTSAVLGRALCHADNCYFVPNALFRGFPCKTNTVSNTAFRGYGGPQGMLGIETVIEHIARALGLDREEVRRRNYYGAAPRNVTPYGQPVTDNLMPDLADRLLKSADYEGRRRAIAEWNRTNRIVRKGLAMMPIKFGISFNVPTLNQAGALVHVYTDGSVILNHGGTEMGQGLYVKVAQVVAETFQIDVANVKVSAASTAKVPNTSATAASSGSDLNGMAAFNAAGEIKRRMGEVAAAHFGCAPDEVRFADNRIWAGNKSISFAEGAKLTWQARVSLSATGFYKTPDLSWDSQTLQGSPFYYYSYGAAAAEVAVDTLTGENHVLRVDLLQDVGASLNPVIDLGQIEGAFVQGQGWVTTEELWWDKDGRLRTHGPSTYKIPGSRDVAPVFNVHLLADAPNRKPTIFRSKAIGEPPLMLALSVWLAVRDAVASVADPGGDGKTMFRLDPPATPEKVLKAIGEVAGR
jgi:xanthine dehydrogenase large subunit